MELSADTNDRREGAMRPSASSSAHRHSGKSAAAALPNRLPVGASYVVEGRSGKNGRFQVSSRYVVLPGGRRINVPADFGQAGALPRPRASRTTRRVEIARPAAKKVLGRTGTTHR
jgi:hypothetical protein